MRGEIYLHQKGSLPGMACIRTDKNRVRKFTVRIIVLSIAVNCILIVFFTIYNFGEAVKHPLSQNYTFSLSSDVRRLNRLYLDITASLPHDVSFTFSEPVVKIDSVTADYLFNTDSLDGISYDEPIIAVGKRSLFKPERSFKDTKPMKNPENRCNMREELISLDELDYGRYGAVITRDHAHKRNIGGFLHIATLWGQQLRIPDKLKRSVINLAEALNRYTGIKTEIDSHLMLDSRRLHSTPFVFITTDRAFELTTIEQQNFGTYLRNGGFAFIDNGTPEYPHGQAEASLRRMLYDSLGAHARFLPVPVSHPVYHSFFDFDDGPPLGAEVQPFTTEKFRGGCSSGDCRHYTMSRPVRYLEGIWFEGRLVAIYSDKGYSQKWRQQPTINSANNMPQLKMGVNMVVFALTQRDGIADRNSEWYF